MAVRVYYCSVCFITAAPITKLFAWGGEDSGGHVLRETTIRGLCGLVCPSRTGTREEPGTLTQGAPVFPGSSRLGIEPKTPGWLVRSNHQADRGSDSTIRGSGAHLGRRFFFLREMSLLGKAQMSPRLPSVTAACVRA
jgi:hypothetical protein